MMTLPVSPFWLSFGLGLYVIRFLADYAKLRLYVPGKVFHVTTPIHIHHFLFGFLTCILAFVYYRAGDRFIGDSLAGISAALWASEAKELVLQNWQH